MYVDAVQEVRQGLQRGVGAFRVRTAEAWAAEPGSPPAGAFGGWLWRYDLVPLDPSGTELTLTYDWSAVPQSTREYLQFPPFGPEHLANSLRHLAGLATPTSRASTPGGPGHRTPGGEH